MASFPPIKGLELTYDVIISANHRPGKDRTLDDDDVIISANHCSQAPWKAGWFNPGSGRNAAASASADDDDDGRMEDGGAEC